jgi:hypothetical protein
MPFWEMLFFPNPSPIAICRDAVRVLYWDFTDKFLGETLMPYAYRSKQQTRDAVLKVLTDSDRPLTRKEISEAIDRVKGKQIIQVIEDCVAEGLISRTVVKLYEHLDAYAYFIPAGKGERK